MTMSLNKRFLRKHGNLASYIEGPVDHIRFYRHM
jgi:hypothetical protein